MAELLNELDALPGVDLMAFTALDEEQILDFIHGPDGSGGEGLTDPDAVPENVKTRCKAGDLWQLGEHRLLCGDSTKKEDVTRLMAGEKADITFTSPPYNAGKSESLSGNTHTKGNKYIGGHNDDMDGGSWLSLIQISLEMSRKVSSFQFYNLQQLAGNKIELIDLLYANRKYFADVAIWDKQNTAPAMAENVMNSQFEYVFIFSCEKSPNRAIRTGNFRGNVSNVYSGNPQRNNEFSDTHAATFPVDFPEHFISKFANIEKTVYEPFCGSGTTIIACEKTNRKCYGMEIDPHYCDVIIKRWEDFTGEKAKKLKPSRQNK
jgi:DNA modification methylase